MRTGENRTNSNPDPAPGSSESARSARQHKAWGAASEASKPQDRNPKGFQPAERATHLECGGKRSASLLWIQPMIKSAIVFPTSRALCRRTPKSCHPLRGFFYSYGNGGSGSGRLFNWARGDRMRTVGHFSWHVSQ
jgi:hypothetical protein